MSLNVVRGKLPRAQRVIIYGPEGIGKTTLASKFPSPLFIDTEGSTSQLNVARAARPTSWTMLKQMVEEFRRDPGDFETLVIDTADWAEQLCLEHVCAVANKTGIEEFGYGKGYTYAAEEWGRFLNLLTNVQEIGVNVVLLAHAKMRKFEQPDEMGAYDRWELKLSKTCGPLAVEWSDMMLFANFKVIVVEVEKKKKAQGGQRVIYTQHHPCWDAKNRAGLADELPMEFASISAVIPRRATLLKPAAKDTPPRPAPASQPPAPQPTPAPAHQPAPEPPPAPAKPLAEDPTAFPAKLFDLMERHGVSADEIKAVVAARGYYPIQTPIGNYDERFVDGVLVAAWDKVFAAIQQTRSQKGVAA